jgi:hypothetical protein
VYFVAKVFVYLYLFLFIRCPYGSLVFVGWLGVRRLEFPDGRSFCELMCCAFTGWSLQRRVLSGKDGLLHIDR